VLRDYQWELAEVRLVPGNKGIFDVSLGGRMLFSKHRVGRFPDYQEILEQLRPVLGEPQPPDD
jgi:selenoprotein W-related protein